MFYYAGHGVQVDGVNYLIPVKTDFETFDDIKADAVSMPSVANAIEAGKATVSLLILDACRDNPFAKKMTRAIGGGTRGLSVVQSGGGANGSAIMFSTSPGDVALDGNGRNGVFTAALLKYLNSDLKLEDMFKKVTADVRDQSSGNQKPWINASLTGDFYVISDDIRNAHLAAAAKAAEEARQAELAKAAEAARAEEARKVAVAQQEVEAARKSAAEAVAAKNAAETAAAAKTAEVTAAQKQSEAQIVALAAKAAEDAKRAEAALAAAQKATNEAKAAVAAAGSGKQIIDGVANPGVLSFDWLQEGYDLRIDGVAAKLIPGSGNQQLMPYLAPKDYTVAIKIPQMGIFQQTVTVPSGQVVPVAKPFQFFLDGYGKQRDTLVKSFNAATFWKVTGIVCMAAGLAGGGMALYGYFTGNDTYNQYKAATNAATATDLGHQMDTYKNFVNIGTYAGSSSFLLGFLMAVISPDPVKITGDITQLDAAVSTLKSESGSNEY